MYIIAYIRRWNVERYAYVFLQTKDYIFYGRILTLFAWEPQISVIVVGKSFLPFFAAIFTCNKPLLDELFQ